MLTEDMEVHPCGTTILVEIVPVDDNYEGSIIKRPTNETKRETTGRDIGVVKEIGPYAYEDFKKDGLPMTHSKWGYEIGDVVEFNRYNGKAPRIAETFEQHKNLRYINDNHIVAVYKKGAK